MTIIAHPTKKINKHSNSPTMSGGMGGGQQLALRRLNIYAPIQDT
jgi:hypothetical protein